MMQKAQELRNQVEKENLAIKVILDETESKHAIRVLRLSEGNQVQLIDGKGGFYEAEISDAHHFQSFLQNDLSIKTWNVLVSLYLSLA